ncbi:hypothetical protein QQ045_008491 [Rhodiola kirilowii]
MHTTHQISSWEAMAKDLRSRFGPSMFWRAEVAINKLRQESSVATYIAEFEDLSVRTPGLSTENLLYRFMAGLKDEIHNELVLLNPTTLQSSMGMARLAEQKLHLPRVWREKGLCYNCDEKYTTDHSCIAKFQCYLMEDPSDPIVLEDSPQQDEKPEHCLVDPQITTEDTEHPNISFNALQGRFATSTLHIQGWINGMNLTVLVDSGSTHNFVQTRIAKHLQLPIEPTANLNVTVGNGEALRCNGACANVPLQMGDHMFEVDLYLLPIFGAEVVLGANWLAEIGPAL